VSLITVNFGYSESIVFDSYGGNVFIHLFYFPFVCFLRRNFFSRFVMIIFLTVIRLILCRHVASIVDHIKQESHNRRSVSLFPKLCRFEVTFYNSQCII